MSQQEEKFTIREPYVGARALKEEFAGVSPHSLRMKIVAYMRELDKLKRRYAQEAIEIKAIHKRNVELELEASQLCRIINRVSEAVKAQKGSWVIGDPDLPTVVREILLMREERDRLSLVADGFTQMWKRVSPSEKRRILGECDAENITEVKHAIEMSVRLFKDDPEEESIAIARSEGRILSFAVKGDRF